MDGLLIMPIIVNFFFKYSLDVRARRANDGQIISIYVWGSQL